MILASAAALPGAALAAEDIPLAMAPAAQAGPSQTQSDAELSAMAGGQSTTTAIAMTDQDLTAVSSGNLITADSVASGAISLTGNALSGLDGIGNFTFNTGHNNTLQSSMSVTVIVTN